MKYRYSFLLLLLLLVITACTEQSKSEPGSASTPLPPSAGIIETDDFQGMIFSAEQIAASDHWPNKKDPWTPSEEDIFTLEKQLNSYLREAHPHLQENLASYTRQYWGTVTDGGNRAIYANFFCDDHGAVSKGAWQTDLVFYLDGGDCYFQTLYDIEDGIFMWLAINGVS